MQVKWKLKIFFGLLWEKNILLMVTEHYWVEGKGRIIISWINEGWHCN